MQSQKKAFTLVELIVVITILAILGTIAFLSFQGYSKSARDSTRISDLNTIETSLELFSLQTGYYPEPTGTTPITYSGSEVWSQGTVGNSVFSKLVRLNKKPVDPLTGSQYTYSRLNTKKEFELAAVLEDGNIASISQVNAGDKVGFAHITGNYNGVAAKVSTGSQLYILAVPTLINGDISVTDYQSILIGNNLVIDGEDNLPASYDNTIYIMNTGYEEGITNPIVYNSGSELPKINSEVNQFIINLQNTYSGSTLSNDGNLALIINTVGSDNILILGESIVKEMLGGSYVAQLTPSCDVDPGYPNATFTAGTPTSTDQAWQNTNNAEPCYYECTGGYTGNDCSNAPSAGDINNILTVTNYSSKDIILNETVELAGDYKTTITYNYPVNIGTIIVRAACTGGGGVYTVNGIYGTQQGFDAGKGVSIDEFVLNLSNVTTLNITCDVTNNDLRMHKIEF